MPSPLAQLAETQEEVQRHVDIEASPEEVWELVSTDEGRESWLEPQPDREIYVESADAPHRLVWWWWRGEESPRRVALTIVAVPDGSRVIVTESAPEFPMARLRAAFGARLALV